MNTLGRPTCIDELACVRECPAMRTPLVDGDFIPDWFAGSTPDVAQAAQIVGRYRFPGTRETYIFSVRPCLQEGRWYAWGEYSPWGRKITDACYQFLDGGGSFNNRSAAVWAIHTYIAHLAAVDAHGAAQNTNAIAYA